MVLPLLRGAGDRWAAGSLCPGHEHLLSVNVRRVVVWLTEAAPVGPDAPVLFATTPSDQWHEFGPQIAGAVAAHAGWGVVLLGPNLPASDVARAAEITGSQAVALGITIVQCGVLLGELRDLRTALPPETAIIVGGRAADLLEKTLGEIGCS